ncbi:MAG TPA: L,D-transpeptidase family protein, partial [Thermoleophilia bacterium]|nr:L,D-transpeptidase family protein [Thermoleophilia bacterium]
SSESLGERSMGPSARGADVTALQKVLQRRGLLDREPTGVFDAATAEAVVAFKVARGSPATPVLDAESLLGLLGSIVIDRSERKLYLYDGGQLVLTYPVAVGQPRYPTPTGKFRIVSKVYHPSWTPPPSPWAEGLEPVPAGPDNPLGTRWMGLSARHVGIHGTYQSGSIGTAASHGCIRMRIRDVEDLFERVFVGTPVEIIP